VEFGKVRDNVNLGKDFKPFTLHWKKDPQTDKIRWWIETSEDEEKGIGSEPPEVDPVPARVINEAYLDTFDKKEASVLRRLATEALKGTDKLPLADIEKKIDVGTTTTRKICNKLKAAGNIVVEGDGRATRYRLSDKMLEDVFQKKVMYAT